SRNKAQIVSFGQQLATSAQKSKYYKVFTYCSFKISVMENKPLRNDLFLYDLAIRLLAFWTTILFSLLFFTGAQASKKTDVTAGSWSKTITHTYEVRSERK